MRFPFFFSFFGSVLAASVLGTLSLCGAEEVTPGTLVERVVCLEDATQSYALYLPSHFTAERSWPVLFCFDASARGRLPVERFQAAAEKFGYVLVGSNNSRNGSGEETSRAIKAIFRDALARWSADKIRLYATGCSGGARVASELGLVGRVRGVVACGGGFTDGETPHSVKCLYLGVAGVDDFNYGELKNVDRALEKNALPHRFMSFAGGHEWLPSETATEALEWLEIQSMRTGLRPVDPAVVEAGLRRRVGALKGLGIPERWFELKALIADFSGLVDAATLEKFEKLEKELGEKSEVRAWQKEERAQDRRQAALVEELLEGPLPAEIAMWRRRADAAEDAPERRLARRALGAVYVASCEMAGTAIRQAKYEQAQEHLNLAITVKPERAFTYFELARVRALDGDRKGGLSALKEAAARGFKDLARVEQEEAFAALRKDAAFEEVREAIRINLAAG